MFTRELEYYLFYIGIYKEIYYEGLAHGIMEKSRNMLSASWRSRKAGVVVLVQTKGLRSRKAMV